MAAARAEQIRSQQQRQRGWKLYSFHAPEVECIGKGKASAPYEFGVKASIVTTNARAPGGQFVLHAKALPGSPYDGHTLSGVIDATEKLTGCAIERAYVDKGYFLTGDEVNQTAPPPGCKTAHPSELLRLHADEDQANMVGPSACWPPIQPASEFEPT